MDRKTALPCNNKTDIQLIEPDKPTNLSDNDKKVSYKKKTRKKLMVVGTVAGKKQDSNKLKAVSSFTYYHVYQVHPNTYQDDLVDYLKKAFQEATCEKLDSKYPDEYPSFKVGIFENNKNKFLQPSI